MVGPSPTLLFSAYFGTLNLDKAAILSFPQGLPGFETERRFAAVQIPGQHPLVYLQSVATADLCLLTFPVLAIDSQFRPQITAEDRTVLEFSPESDTEDDTGLLALAIVAVDPAAGPTANMAAPLIVNLRNYLAIQALQPDPALSCQHPLTASQPTC